MKKLLVLLMVLMLALTLAACGGTEEPASTEEPAGTEEPASTGELTEEELAEEIRLLSESAKKLAAVFNEVLPIAQANGWDKDELFIQEANATVALVEVCNEIIKDPSMLEGDNAQVMIEGCNDMATEWDTNMREKVSKPLQ